MTSSRTPCGFCFVEYYTHSEALASMRYISGTKLDERIIRCDLDLGYKEGRQFGRGKSGGQVRTSHSALTILSFTPFVLPTFSLLGHRM